MIFVLITETPRSNWKKQVKTDFKEERRRIHNT